MTRITEPDLLEGVGSIIVQDMVQPHGLHILRVLCKAEGGRYIRVKVLTSLRVRGLSSSRP